MITGLRGDSVLEQFILLPIIVSTHYPVSTQYKSHQFGRFSVHWLAWALHQTIADNCTCSQIWCCSAMTITGQLNESALQSLMTRKCRSDKLQITVCNILGRRTLYWVQSCKMSQIWQIYRVFFLTGAPPKSSKYKKVTLG